MMFGQDMGIGSNCHANSCTKFTGIELLHLISSAQTPNVAFYELVMVLSSNSYISLHPFVDISTRMGERRRGQGQQNKHSMLLEPYKLLKEPGSGRETSFQVQKCDYDIY